MKWRNQCDEQREPTSRKRCCFPFADAVAGARSMPGASQPQDVKAACQRRPDDAWAPAPALPKLVNRLRPLVLISPPPCADDKTDATNNRQITSKNVGPRSYQSWQGFSMTPAIPWAMMTIANISPLKVPTAAMNEAHEWDPRFPFDRWRHATWTSRSMRIQGGDKEELRCRRKR